MSRNSELVKQLSMLIVKCIKKWTTKSKPSWMWIQHTHIWWQSCLSFSAHAFIISAHSSRIGILFRFVLSISLWSVLQVNFIWKKKTIICCCCWTTLNSLIFSRTHSMFTVVSFSLSCFECLCLPFILLFCHCFFLPIVRERALSHIRSPFSQLFELSIQLPTNIVLISCMEIIEHMSHMLYKWIC